MDTIKPPRLREGGTIGIVSPSQSVKLEPQQTKGFYKGIKTLERLGFKVKIGKHAEGKYFYSSGRPEERAEDIHEMFLDNEVQAILMSIGGETANEVLPLLDEGLIKTHPKIFMGMSDGATLLAPITDGTGMITFYGPDLIYSFGLQKAAKPFNTQIFNCLMNGEASFPALKGLRDDRGKPITDKRKTVRGGEAQGKLVGGYLETIESLIATKYLENLDGAILYLESMEGSNTIHMRLQYMELLKVFNKVAGVILGYFPDVEKSKGLYRPVGDILIEIARNKNFPILQVNELGHYVKNYAWPNGLKVKLDATNQQIIALESCVS